MSNEYLVGQKILGYELQELIGSGGFGKVYKGVKKVGKDEYYAAIKHISLPKNNEYNDLLNSMGRNYEAVDKYYEKILEDMVNEINTLFYLSKKDNKNIVTYYDHDIVKEENPLKYDIFIRMEYLKPLNIYSNEGNMTVEDAINLGIDIARALDNCHKQGIIHRDVKDGNIFISEDGYFKLGDFGISRMLSDTNQTLSMKGTPIFMAPEVILGKYYDKTVDIYSLGIVLYKLLNYNRIPFLPNYPEIYTSRDTDIAMNIRLSGEKFDKPQNASDELGQVILKACETQGSRYGSCEEFIYDLIKVKDEMSDYELSKYLFESCNNKVKNEMCSDLDDTYIIKQEDIDDTVILDNSCENDLYEVELDYKCIYEENTVNLDDSNNKDLIQNESIYDDTVVLDKLDDIKNEEKNIYNRSVKANNNTLKMEILIVISAIIFIASLILLMVFTSSKDASKGMSGKILMEDLPIESEGIGNLSSNYIPVFEDGTSRCSIVSGLNEGYTYQGDESGIIEYEYDSPTTGYYLTEYFSVCLNRLGDEIYHIKRDTSEVKKVNVKTKEINDVYGIKARQIITLGNDLYYTDASDENSHIYKVDLSSGKKETILDEDISRFSINRNKILYQYNGSEELYMLDLNTKELNNLGITVSDGKFALYENCFMYIQDDVLYRSDIGIKKQQQIVSRVKEFTVDSKYLHYIDKKIIYM